MKKNDEMACPRVDIGGQAVMEGVMMKAPDAIAVTVRRPDGRMVCKRTSYVPLSRKHPWMGWPFIRGAVNMVSMLVMGMNVLQESTNMLGILDEEPTKFEKWLARKLGKGVDKIVMAMAMVLAVALSVGLFIAVPAGIEQLCRNAGMAPLGYTLIAGLVKIGILIGYMVLVAFVPDVRRTFQYHGAEHKTVYCHEADLPLTPENAKPFTCLHPRCGTAFLLIVMIISMLLFLVLNILVPIGNYFLRLLFHLCMLPIVAGTSYEVLKGLAHSSSGVAKVLRWPGLQMQRLTTREPDEKMLECAIVSMNVALHGIPKHVTPGKDGSFCLKSYRESDPAYVPEAAEPAETEAAETEAEAEA